LEAAAQSYARMTVASLLRGTVGRRAFAGHGPNELGAAEAAVLSRWIVVVLACLGYSRSELRVGGENIRVRKRKRRYHFHLRWGASSVHVRPRDMRDGTYLRHGRGDRGRSPRSQC
jgi:hypothetical protein